MLENNEINDSENFMLDLEAQARAEDDFLEHTFFTIYKNITLEAGYTEEVEHTPYRSQGLQVDGFHCDIDGTIKDVYGNLTLIINDFRSETKTIESLNTENIKNFFKKVENFFFKM